MNKIRNNFFAGNDQLGKDRRKPQTLKTYIVSYRLFLKFVLSRQEDIRQLMEFGDDDIRQVQSALRGPETWPKAYSDTFNLRKAEVRRRDEDERLSHEHFRSFVNSQRATEIAKEYENVRENPTRALDLQQFAELPDYLLLRVITASGQRCGAAERKVGDSCECWHSGKAGLFHQCCRSADEQEYGEQANYCNWKEVEPRVAWKSARVVIEERHYYTTKIRRDINRFSRNPGKADEPLCVYRTEVL